MKGEFVFVICVCILATTTTTTSQVVEREPIAKSLLPHDSNERVTPDYVKGPWFPMEPEQGVLPHTQRPRVVQALDLLREVVENVNQATEEMIQTRNKTLHKEQKIIREGSETIDQLKQEIEEIKMRGENYNKIVPTQNSITDTIQDTLSELLKDKSEIHQIEADVRLPFADRLADYTADLQKVLRSKEEAECQLKEFLSPPELKALVDQFAKLAKEIQDKIDSEVAAAGEILNPNAQRLEDNTKEMETTHKEIERLRTELQEYMSNSQGFIPRNQEVKELTLTDTEHLNEAMTRVVTVQDNLLASTKVAQEKQQEIVHHAASLLSSLLVDDNSPVQDATEPSLAMQSVNRN